MPMNDELRELDELLRGPVDGPQCARLAELVVHFPGRQRQVITRLTQSRHSAGVEALLSFPPTIPGVLEGMYHGIRLGLTRDQEGHRAPEIFALEFPHSRAKSFPALLAHARAAFPDHVENLTVEGKRWYRLSIAATGSRRILRQLLTAHGGDLVYLHGRLAKLRRARLWLNGWRFASAGPWTSAHQVHLVQAWVEHASREPAS